MVRIKNIYYMLAYAYQILNEEGYNNITAEDFDYASDLFAAILSKGITNQIKRGLNKEYLERTEAINRPIGKINISASIKQNFITKKQFVCDYDELLENSYMNKILKTTAMLLLRCQEVSIKNKNALKKVMLYFNEVDEIKPEMIQWSSIKYHRNNSTYKMLLNICYLIIEGMLMTEQNGTLKISRFIDNQHMHRLFEKFVLEYYRRHYPELNASAAHIDWDVNGRHIEYLPVMKSDITLRYKNKILIIDTKYYSKTMQTNSLFENKTFHSNNLYQIFTYVKNMESFFAGKVSGLILYAKTDEEIVPDK
ncbi:5-methylcytosine restriction system specificity protein McrC [Caloramator sp. Dgby_cultured_2]|uniref:5-methylcytosine restriction system specificity protein McrC n=1 Tax=Caloramator sp. Dgby_cultured_2 TaxID=3029174 RepID=UPI0031593F08